MKRRSAFAALALLACGPAGGPSGRFVAGASPDARPLADVETSNLPDAAATPDAGRVPGCPLPELSDIRATTFIPRCAIPDCHAAPGREGLILSLETEALRARLLMPSTQSPSGLPLVARGEIGRSYLYLKVFAQPVTGERMPPTGPLPMCEIQAIKDWISRGARD